MAEEKQPKFTQGFLDGVRQSIGISIAGSLFSGVFGVLAIQAGLSVLQGLIFSSAVYAGALQMISLHLWPVQPIPTFTLVALSFVVCARYLLMGMVLRPKLDANKSSSVYRTLFFVADENWALTILRSRTCSDPHYLQQYLLGSGINFYLFWVIGSFIGLKAGQYISHPQYFALDFAFIAIFLALLIGMWHGKHDLLPWFVAAVSAVIASQYIGGQWYIVIGALLGSISGVIRDVLAT